MKYFLLTFFLFQLSILSFAQKNYEEMTSEALHIMWEAKDSTDLRRSLSLYEAAFSQFPDSIEVIGSYKASVLAGELKLLDKAFDYLKRLVEQDHYLSWQCIVGDYAESEYAHLLHDPRWEEIQVVARRKKALFIQQLHEAETEFWERDSLVWDDRLSPQEQLQQIKKAKPFRPKAQQNYSISFRINDTATTSFFVHLPPSYKPDSASPVLFFLHGAVRGNRLQDFQTDDLLGGWNRYYRTYADQHGVILVFPQGSREFNWMIPDEGFFMVPEILRQLKQTLNIDDNKVFISGHSNGASGSFSYWMKAPSAFAGFYGFNTYPKVFTGGTFIRNHLNRSFLNFSTDQDYYYPPQANDSLNQVMLRLGADYQDHRYDGFPHWFPAFDASEAAHERIFTDIIQRERNPYPKQIYWETDDKKHGTVDWLQIVELDTVAAPATWHQSINFEITSWLDYDENDSLISKQVDKQAFDFPRKSGAIQASYVDNVFTISSSCINSFRLYLSPEMIDIKRSVKVFVNGKLHVDQIVGYDREVIRHSFESTRDRKQIWVNVIDISL